MRDAGAKRGDTAMPVDGGEATVPVHGSEAAVPAHGGEAPDWGPGAPAGWYAALLGGLIPVLVAGFLTSAAADRLVFLAWGLGVGAVYTGTLHRSFAAGRGWRAPAPLAALAVGAVLFAALILVYREDVILGFAALAPAGGTP